MYDEPLQISVTGLSSQQDVVLRARATDDRGNDFTSWAEFRADHSGQVSVWQDAPLRGSYSGVQPMGLLCSMTPVIKYKKFTKTSALRPHLVHFSVHDKQTDLTLAQETNERCILGNGVQREVVTERGFTGVLFTPPGPGPFPAVLDLCTFSSEKRAALLANKGFLVMMVPVYTLKLNQSQRLQLDQHEAAVQFLLGHHKVGSAQVGVVARSKGGDLALSLAAFVRGVGAVVWINGCSANVNLPLFYKQEQILPALQADLSKCTPISSEVYMVKNVLPVPTSREHHETLVPIEKASARFLFVAAEDDLNWDSVAFMQQMVERLKRNKRDNYEMISYPGAGHLLEPPFSPLIALGFHEIAKKPVLWGGEPVAHVDAELHLWKKIQEFLSKHLYMKYEPIKATAKL